MSVKVSLSGEVGKEKSFPKLMISGNQIVVLFRVEKEGVVVRGGLFRDVGEYYDMFDMSKFTDYNEEVTLKNE
jgi:hypothetical protein